MWCETQEEETAGAAPAAHLEVVPVDGPGTLYVDLDMGSVTVEAHDESAVSVEAGPAETIELFVERDEDDVHVEGAPGACFAGLVGGSAPRLHLKVPRQFSVDVETRGGRIRVSEVSGRVAAETGGGEITLRGVSGPMMLRSGGGSIRIQDSKGALRARTLGGSIVVKDLDGSVDLKSGGGSIRASEVSGSVEAKTGAGLIVASFSGSPSGSLETAAGSIVVNLCAGTGAEIDARTGAGRVRLDRGIPFQGRRGKSQLVGTLGEGGAQLRLRAVLGAIHLRERRCPRSTSSAS